MPDDVTPDTHCQTCGAKLDPSILGGGCPACLWSDIIGGEEDEKEAIEDAPEIEGYDILEEIGSGGMGLVYRARQHTPDREVALKIVAPYSLRAAQARQRFMVEVDAMASVEHPALLPLYDAGEDKHGRPWLTMQLAHGGTLADRLERYSGKWKDTARLMIRLCAGVHYAHARGILHRDLKPANILFDENEHAYIADFGLAKWADDDGSITRSSYLLGSPAYLAPEAAAGGSKVTTTVSDVYGLGAVLYELLCGDKPYSGTVAAEILTQILDHSPVSPRAKLSNIPRDLEVIVMKAMAREPDKRYTTAADFSDDLNRWLEGKAILARRASPLERGWLWAKRNPALATLSLLLLVSLITGGVLLWDSNKKLTASLDDAEARVDFMTRELPARLEPLGRLDLLDSVFENVNEHYELNPRADPESMARQADFLTQWSQVLRPQGRIKATVTRLEMAVEKAKAATRIDDFSVEAARARISAGRRLGEAMIENGQLAAARSALSDARSFSKQASALHPDDLRLRALITDLIMETSILELEDGKPEQALIEANEAINQWQEIIPLLEKDVSNPHNQSALVNATQAQYFVAQVHHRLGDTEKATQRWQLYLKMTQRLVNTFPDNLRFRRQRIVARQFYLLNRRESDQISDEDELTMRLESDTDAVMCISQAPGNVRWRLDAVSTAHDLAGLAQRRKNKEDELHWLAICAQRLVPLNKLYITDVSFLYRQRNFSGFCGESYKKYDWEKARYHIEASIRVHLKICSLNPNSVRHRRLQNVSTRFFRYLQTYEDNQAAITWLTSMAEVCKQEAVKADSISLWQWSEAFMHARIALLQPGTPEALVSIQKSFDLLLEAASEAEVLPRLPGDLLLTATALLDNTVRSPFEQATTITRLLKVLPSVRKELDMDEKWLTLILKHAPQLQEDMRKVIAARTLKLFFPNGGGENSQYLQLKNLQ